MIGNTYYECGRECRTRIRQRIGGLTVWADEAELRAIRRQTAAYLVRDFGCTVNAAVRAACSALGIPYWIIEV